MEYIHSKDIFLLMRDTLKLMDVKTMDHSSRVAYYLYKMLECKGGYEKFELADFVFMASLHDIGAYKTENIKNRLQYEYKEPMAHSAYGYLVFKNLSPLREFAKVILYHHTDYSQLAAMDYEYKDIAAYLNLAEKVDVFATTLGDKFELSMFRKQAGTIISPDALKLFEEADKKYHIMSRTKNVDYKEELDDIVSYMIFANEDKRRSLEMLMYMQGLKQESLVLSAVSCMCISETIGQKAGLSELEKEQLYYGTLLHDIGMLAVANVTQAARDLTEEEYKKVKMHVLVAEKVLKNRMAKEVVEIVAAHHERCDGSGYPRGLKEMQMNRNQMIVQFADSVAALLEERPFRPALGPEELQKRIIDATAAGRYNKAIVKLFLDSFDEIMEHVRSRVDETLVTYRKLNRQYNQVSEKLK